MNSETETKSRINVSDDFMHAYSNLNVNSQVEIMKTLSKKELYLLLITCIDKFSYEDPIVVKNLTPFKYEIIKIYDIQDDKDTDDEDLLSLIQETNDKHIDTSNIYYNDEKLPEPLDIGGVRDAKINLIVK